MRPVREPLAEELVEADIVAGIPSYNNASTIGQVVRAVDAGLGKYFPNQKAVIINSDGGSTDKTPEAVTNANVDHKAVFITHPLRQAHRITVPYHGIPGKGSAFRAIFQMARTLGAKACCVVDADLRSITPEWMELLLSPVFTDRFDLVAPLYNRHKYDGTITNSIIYPVTRALYGRRIRQPIGGDFCVSGRLYEHYLSQNVWESDIARYGIDIWMTTEAIAGGFNICQSYLGAKIHDPKDPGADLSDMFIQVVGSLMALTEKHFSRWMGVAGSFDVPTFGFKYTAAPSPVKADLDNMLKRYRIGVDNLRGVWEAFMGQEIINALQKVSNEARDDFRFPKELWVRIIYDYMLAHHHKKLSEEHLMKSLLPLYLGRTASFFMEMADKTDEEAEEDVESLCVNFEEQKNYLLSHW